ncbi:hypothetical protein [Brevundimonas sp. SORGH_AS_0993]|uniref:hypothetical protein n=1 Tax=Brevundimonas sp. SORGH_AS_0993 TaxID=3041794 RepID=UPI00277EB34F|nr:hypothetical protein [Brevundimonas sp. SORGH_AS_0993]MDQ1154027.1 hypothetical protein [Brevundimonas sp. SORGH_AS_0993]
MKSRFAAAVAALLFGAVAVSAPTFAAAQQRGPDNQPTATQGQSRAASARQQRRQRAPAAPSPEQILASAQEQMNLTDTGCHVSEAKLLGVTAAGTSLYEVACGAAVGYLVETKTPPEATDCILVAQAASTARATDPAAPTGPQCTLAANADTQKFLRQYAQDAGVTCTVDQAKVRGRSNDGAVVYEVGCADAPGYWIKKAATGWSKTPCIQIIAESGACEYTTAAENAGFVKALLAGSPAASCNVTEARLMGRNANGVFYEAKCDGADGVIARVNDQNAVQQIYPCATAQQIGGGCKLTTAPAAAAPAPASGGRL